MLLKHTNVVWTLLPLLPAPTTGLRADHLICPLPAGDKLDLAMAMRAEDGIGTYNTFGKSPPVFFTFMFRAVGAGHRAKQLGAQQVLGRTSARKATGSELLPFLPTTWFKYLRERRYILYSYYRTIHLAARQYRYVVQLSGIMNQGVQHVLVPRSQLVWKTGSLAHRRPPTALRFLRHPVRSYAPFAEEVKIGVKPIGGREGSTFDFPPQTNTQRDTFFSSLISPTVNLCIMMLPTSMPTMRFPLPQAWLSSLAPAQEGH
ncbi:hypothetical protein B0H13DRAFT_2268503 [Mycena leptocephala]|nr:hypothetical protein B0H13DRAFT_2268503 [Mycena leptocephala]